MNVLVVGGYGVFGGRLARLLVRDGHGVTIAGRDRAAAERLASKIGCEALRVDRADDLSILGRYDVVVDAAGPFHIYGDDPYRLARAAIAARVHYLDFSDDAAFCAGISLLDEEARTAGVCVVSGMSSVPAISSAAVQALARDDEIRVIDTAILPGNRAPRGLSVMHSILAQAGRPMQVWRGRRWEEVMGWSDPAIYRLPGELRRQGWRIEVPDTRLFPAHFGAESVCFRAGLELNVMRYGLAVFAAVQRVLKVPITRPLVRSFKWMADVLAPLGTGRGGMSVSVIAGGERREWALLAEDGEGPFIPAVPIRALLRRPSLPVGARPAICVLGLDEIEEAMADLRVLPKQIATSFTPLVQEVLGESFAALPPEIRATHDTADCSRWEGRAQIDRDSRFWPRLIAALFRFPVAADDVPVTVTKYVTPKGETWLRRFGEKQFRSHLALSPQGLTERFGPFTFLLNIQVADGELHYPVRDAHIGWFRLPRWMLPRVEAVERVRDDRFHFDVALFAPLTDGLIVRYRGWLRHTQPNASPPS